MSGLFEKDGHESDGADSSSIPSSSDDDESSSGSSSSYEICHDDEIDDDKMDTQNKIKDVKHVKNTTTTCTDVSPDTNNNTEKHYTSHNYSNPPLRSTIHLFITCHSIATKEDIIEFL